MVVQVDKGNFITREEADVFERLGFSCTVSGNIENLCREYRLGDGRAILASVRNIRDRAWLEQMVKEAQDG